MVAVVSSLLLIALGGTWFGVACLLMGLVSLFAKSRVVVREVPAPVVPVAVGAWPWDLPVPVSSVSAPVQPEPMQAAPGQHEPEPEEVRPADAKMPSEPAEEPSAKHDSEEPAQPSKVAFRVGDFVGVGSPVDPDSLKGIDTFPGDVLGAVMDGNAGTFRAVMEAVQDLSVPVEAPYFDFSELAEKFQSSGGFIVGFVDPLDPPILGNSASRPPTTRYTRSARSGRSVDGRLRTSEPHPSEDQLRTVQKGYAVVLTKLNGRWTQVDPPTAADSESGDRPEWGRA